VKRLARLSETLGRDDVWLKNDGVFGTIYGGNKPRKLQFVLADAQRRRCRTVLTTGTIGTNHGLATALYAKELGLQTGLLLTYEEPSEETVKNLLRMAATGAHIHYTRSYPLTAAVAPYFVASYWLRDQHKPYLLGPGGSSVLASLGYADAAFELAEQVHAGEVPEPAWIVIPLGTGGTVAGLLAGLRLAGLDTRILAITATRAPTTWRLAVIRLARAVLHRIGKESGERETSRLRLEGLTIDRRWVGPGLGQASAQGDDAAAMLEDLEGLHLDPVYTAKSMAALIGRVKAGGLRGPVLFWQTYNAIPQPEPEASVVDHIPDSLRRICHL
jgi:D-cysteine desulfhydrase